MKKLIEGLKHFQNHVLWERREQYERSAQSQKPQAFLITCSDSHVLPDGYDRIRRFRTWCD